jgi:hypothetical protein
VCIACRIAQYFGGIWRGRRLLERLGQTFEDLARGMATHVHLIQGLECKCSAEAAVEVRTGRKNPPKLFERLIDS